MGAIFFRNFTFSPNPAPSNLLFPPFPFFQEKLHSFSQSSPPSASAAYSKERNKNKQHEFDLTGKTAKSHGNYHGLPQATLDLSAGNSNNTSAAAKVLELSTLV